MRIKILFLGQDKCPYGTMIVSKMQSLGWEVTCYKSCCRGEVLPSEALKWEGDYIFSFRTHFIPRENLLSKAKFGALNFHPGPPEYPGSASVNFALLDGATSYGATAHLMSETVDSGVILRSTKFEISLTYSVREILAETHIHCVNLMLYYIDLISNEKCDFNSENYHSGEVWRGKPRRIRELQALERINPNIGKSELEVLVRAIYTPEYPPYIDLHGFRFFLKL